MHRDHQGPDTGEYFEFHGEFYDIPKTKMSPAPTEPIPILIGGHADVASRRADRNDGWMHGGGDLGDSEWSDRFINRLKKLREEEGRTGPFEIHAMSLDAYKPDGIRRLEDPRRHRHRRRLPDPLHRRPRYRAFGEQDPQPREVRREGHLEGATSRPIGPDSA